MPPATASAAPNRRYRVNPLTFRLSLSGRRCPAGDGDDLAAVGHGARDERLDDVAADGEELVALTGQVRDDVLDARRELRPMLLPVLEDEIRTMARDQRPELAQHDPLRALDVDLHEVAAVDAVLADERPAGEGRDVHARG